MKEDVKQTMLWQKCSCEEAYRYPPLVLAYVGDAVFELYVRTRLAATGNKMNRIHQDAIGLVSAKAMARYYGKLVSHLTENEKEVLQRGRNVKSRQIKSADVGQYHKSTGFEALVGYLFLSSQEERLAQLLALLPGEEDEG